MRSDERLFIKIILLLLHCINGFAPHYNIGLIKHYIPYSQLRSQNSGLLGLTQREGSEPSLMLGRHYGISLNGFKITVPVKC